MDLAKLATPQTEAAMRRHMMAEPPAGHGVDSMPDDMPMAAMRRRHASMHEGNAGHEHGTMMAGKLAVKFVEGSDSLVRGLGMPYGGPFDGFDLDGEFFSAKTDFMFDFFTGERPLLYDHGQEPTLEAEVVGRVVDYSKTDDGIWTIAQLDRRARYVDMIRELVEKSALSFSSGAYPYLARVDKSTGEIQRWPWVELSLTPTPANPYAVASKSIRSQFLLPPEPDEPVAPRRRVLTFSKAAWSSSYINSLPDSAFACIDSAGRHYPHHNAQGALDMPHLRAALSRIGDASNTQCGKGHLMRHARASGMGGR